MLESVVILGLVVQGTKCGAFGSTGIGGHDVSSTQTAEVHSIMYGPWQAL